MRAIYPLSVAALALAACNQVNLPDYGSTGSVFSAAKAPAFQHTIAEKRPVHEAFVELAPGGGNVVDVTESRYANGIEQLIVYQGDHDTRGENAARVRMVVGPVPRNADRAGLELSDVSQRTIAAEMRKVLPGTRMQFSGNVERNSYGPFGYASGTGHGKTRCLYAWQKLEGQGGRNLRIPFLDIARHDPALSVRLRVCRTGVSTESLVNLMRTIRIDADPAKARATSAFNWNATNRDIAGDGRYLPLTQTEGYQSRAPETNEPVRIAPPKPKKRKVVRRKPRPAPTPVVSQIPLPPGPTVKAAPAHAKPAVTAPVAPAPTVAYTPPKPLTVAKPANGISAVPLPQ